MVDCMQYGESCPGLLCSRSPPATMTHTVWRESGMAELERALVGPQPGAGGGQPADANTVREIRDHHGRSYRVGESPVELIGRPRSTVLWQAWVPMAAGGGLQYGYGAAVPALMGRNGLR